MVVAIGFAPTRLVAIHVFAALAAGAFDTPCMIVRVTLLHSAFVGRVHVLLACRAFASKRPHRARGATAEALAEGAPEAALPLAEVPPEAPPVELGAFRSRLKSGPCSAGGGIAGALADGCEFAAPDPASAAASLSEIESPAGCGGATGAALLWLAARCSSASSDVHSTRSCLRSRYRSRSASTSPALYASIPMLVLVLIMLIRRLANGMQVDTPTGWRQSCSIMYR